ncbi:hypothetical protein ACIPPM_10170 [Streptomyces sp. NPDC090119]|uniref:hypothetical protein n=1 Tax=Streptomyces sp. NPDC090119 TaxID=3365951 RepID=UPI00382041CC
MLPLPGATDPHSRVRELLAGRILRLPDVFDASALAVAKALAENGDQLLADALTRTGTDGRLAQDLGGGPALVERYRTGSSTARALLEAAMDARRLGVGLHLPQAFLTNAASDYLHDTDYDQLTDDWAEQAYAYLAMQVHGKQAPMRRINPRPQRRPGPLIPDSTPSPQPAGPVFRLADYSNTTAEPPAATSAHLPPSGTLPTPTSLTTTTWMTLPRQPRDATASNGLTTFANVPPTSATRTPCAA